MTNANVTTCSMLKEIDKFTDKYQISFQLWGAGNYNAYIEKDDVELTSLGSENSMRRIFTLTLEYLYKITRTPKEQNIFLMAAPKEKLS